MATHVEAKFRAWGAEQLTHPLARLAAAIEQLPAGHDALSTALIGRGGAQVSWHDLHVIARIAERAPSIMHTLGELLQFIDRGKVWDTVGLSAASAIYDVHNDLRDLGVRAERGSVYEGPVCFDDQLTGSAKHLGDAVRTLPIGHIAHDTAFVGANAVEVTWSDLRDLLEIAKRTPGVMHALIQIVKHIERGEVVEEIGREVAELVCEAVNDLSRLGVRAAPRIDYFCGL
jgi:hypothetical protein